MLEIKTTKNELGLWEAEATLNLPEVKVTIMKAEKDNLKYDLQSRFSEIVNEYVEKHAKDEL
tara:strand:- start:187 stop:372 length:186 start_codon:yes stop_codon:yes gene_type:complete